LALWTSARNSIAKEINNHGNAARIYAAQATYDSYGDATISWTSTYTTATVVKLPRNEQDLDSEKAGGLVSGRVIMYFKYDASVGINDKVYIDGENYRVVTIDRYAPADTTVAFKVIGEKIDYN